MRFTRRTLLRLSGLAPAVMSWPPRRALADPQRARKGGRVTLTILHTNDVHGHLSPWPGWEGDLKGKMVGGLGRLAGAIAQARKSV